MDKPKKMLIAGVGGQGVVYLTNIIVEAALSADMPVASSEIHGLAQRRGSVVAGITFGEDSFGFVEEAGADFMLGLEPLEAQRCFRYLNTGSRVIIDNNMIFPHSVNAAKMTYPDPKVFVDYLQRNTQQVIFNRSFDRNLSPILRNIYILGLATRLVGFPVSSPHIEKAIAKTTKKEYKEVSLKVFRMGKNKDLD